MATMLPPQKGVEYITYVNLTQQANTCLFQSNPTLASGDVTVTTDGNAVTNLDTLPDVDPDASFFVKVTVSATEMNGDNIAIVFHDAAGDEWCDLGINIPTSGQSLDAIDGNVDSILIDTAVIGALGAGLTAIPWNSSWDTEVQSECADALTAYDPPTKAEMDTAHALLATEAKQDTIDTVVDGIQTDLSNATDGLGALKTEIDANETKIDAVIADTEDLQTQVGTAGAGLTDLGGMSTGMKAEVESEVDDAVGGGTGTALTAIPWNSNWDTEVQSECADALTAYDPPTRSEATSDKAAIITEVDANETKIDTVDGVVDGIQTDLSNVTDGLGALKALIDTVDTVADAVLADTVEIQGTGFSTATDALVHIHDDHVTYISAAYGSAQKALIDGLPSGIAKGVEREFTFPMILSSDHETFATGKTLTEEVSKDKGNFAACTNNATEIQSTGVYGITITAAEMNANVVTLRFTETDCDATIITVETS